eukprot:jgi/Botrbrau1/14909/Bobra.0018s0014.1
MVGVEVSTELPVSAESWWKDIHTVPLHALRSKVLRSGYVEIKNDAWDGEDQVVTAVVHVLLGSTEVPRVILPQLEAVGDVAYKEITRFNPQQCRGPPYVYTKTLRPSLVGHKVRMDMTCKIETVSPETCRYSITANCDVGVFGVGSLAERIISDFLEKSFKYLPQVVSRWALFRDEVLRHAGGEQALRFGAPADLPAESVTPSVAAALRAPFDPPSAFGSEAATALLGQSSVPMEEEGRARLHADVAAARKQVLAELARAPSEQFFDAQESATVADETASAAGDIVSAEPTFYDADSAWHWDPDDRYVDDLTTVEALRADAAAAVEWYANYRLSRRDWGYLPPSNVFENLGLPPPAVAWLLSYRGTS